MWAWPHLMSLTSPWPSSDHLLSSHAFSLVSACRWVCPCLVLGCQRQTSWLSVDRVTPGGGGSGLVQCPQSHQHCKGTYITQWTRASVNPVTTSLPCRCQCHWWALGYMVSSDINCLFEELAQYEAYALGTVVKGLIIQVVTVVKGLRKSCCSFVQCTMQMSHHYVYGIAIVGCSVIEICLAAHGDQNSKMWNHFCFL